MIYIAIENEREPLKKLSPQVVLAIQGLTRKYRAIANDFKEKIQPLYAKCEEKMGFINRNPFN